MSIDVSVIQRLVRTWPSRATVRQEEYEWSERCDWKEDLPDYPTSMVPFWNHPYIQNLSSEARSELLTQAWLVYNQRTIDAEEFIANPAFGLVFQGRVGSPTDPAVRQSMQQSMIDEHFHSLMHTTAIERTRAARGVNIPDGMPHSITYREYCYWRDQLETDWERDLLLFTFALVSEVSINAYLNILAEDENIQPNHRMIACLHNRDEMAHAKILIEVSKGMYLNLNDRQRALFIRLLPIGLDAFMKQDDSAWLVILKHLGIKNAEEVISDSRTENSEDHLSRDYSGLHEVATELGILDRLDFDFNVGGSNPPPPRGPAVTRLNCDSRPG